MSEKYRPKKDWERAAASGHSRFFPGVDGVARVPAEYQSYVIADTHMFTDDVAFFRALQTDHGPQVTDSRSRRERFVDATAGFAGYARKFFGDVLDQDDREIAKVEFTDENIRSKKRMQTLASLFLHEPTFSGEYAQIHADKMIEAFPLFNTKLEESPELKYATELGTYMRLVKGLMIQSQDEASNIFDPQHQDTIGLIMGLESRRILSPHRRKEVFAREGVGTFTKNIEEVLAESLSSGDDSEAILRREITEPDGILYRIMRTHLLAFSRTVRPNLLDTTLVERREYLDQHDFPPGLCPAFLPRKAPSDEGTEVEAKKERVALHYALAIGKNIPRGLVLSSRP